MASPKLLLPLEFVETATKHILNASSHVSLVSMVMANDPTTDEIIDALAAAAERGVPVEVAADTFTFGELAGHAKPLKYYSKQSKETKQMVKRLKKSGVKFTWLGKTTAFPFTGRTHSKCLVVDDTVYSFGGVNLYEENLSFTDYMFMIKDSQLALELKDEISRLVVADGSNFAYRSHELTFNEHSKVLIDGGFQGDSIIYRRAYQHARESSEILYVSQYCPAGKLARAMNNTKSRVYFNKPSNADIWNRIIISVGILFSRFHTKYRKKNYLHAKFIIFTKKDGTKVAITGSHNFMPGTVIVGTKEIALETSDKKVISELENFFEKYVK
ncbi:MAG TPA: phospholipase D-like domain-containing protein [Candidatus Saccharimonadales bacterium]